MVKEEKSAADKPAEEAKKKDAKKNGKDEAKEADLSDEDLELKKNLELMVERLMDPDAGVQKVALQSICTEIRTATSSMTSVPKPLKFLRPHYEAMKTRQAALPEGENKRFLADIGSVLATAFPATKEGVQRPPAARQLEGCIGRQVVGRMHSQS